MKKLLLFVVCAFFYCSYAQLPPNSFAEDFTLTDINGNQFNLYSTLDEGKTVILDLFATWCGPCWNYASLGVLSDLQDAYPNDVVVVAVEADPSTAESTLYNSSLGNWTAISDYLMMDDPSGNVADAFMLTGYPTIIKVCPDRMATEVGQIQSVSGFMAEINTCSSAQYSKDAKIVSYNGPGSYCGGVLGASSVMIQNYSLGAPLNSCNVELRINGETTYSTSWNGSLNTYETTMVNIPAQTGIANGSEIAFHIDYGGDMDTDNNGYWPQLSPSTQTSNNISLYIMTDNWPDETTWELLNENGNTVSSGGPYTAPNSVITEEWDLAPGCYTFNVYDQYGDGVEASMWGQYEDGIVVLTDVGSWDGSISQSNLWNGVQYEEQGTTAFEVLPQFDISESSENKIGLFPNPFKDYTNVSVHSSNGGDMEIEIYNTLGEVVYFNNTKLSVGHNNMKIQSGDLLPGVYYINIIIDDKNHLERLSIVK